MYHRIRIIYTAIVFVSVLGLAFVALKQEIYMLVAFCTIILTLLVINFRK